MMSWSSAWSRIRTNKTMIPVTLTEPRFAQREKPLAELLEALGASEWLPTEPPPLRGDQRIYDQ
jgi:hypothetical protein